MVYKSALQCEERYVELVKQSEERLWSQWS